MASWEVRAGKVSGLKLWPLCCLSSSAPGPSPSLHRKQSGDARVYTFLFFCCSLDLT